MYLREDQYIPRRFFMPYYGYGYYGFDWTYLYLVLPCIILSMWASSNVNSTFKKYSKQFSRRGLTGAEAA